jgi:hypothetical protein
MDEQSVKESAGGSAKKSSKGLASQTSLIAADEWANLENILQNNILPLCEKEQYDSGKFTHDFLIHYCRLNTEYNIVHGKYLSGDVVSSEVSIKNAKEAAAYVEHIYTLRAAILKGDYDFY